ncbi:hypothetical protein LTR62_002134 [Meristemomyces frigidus]|uniref:DUF7918 domain-containing protein n=1 Tax=Meristemomyces frigidus TaxID=1508187 RepID=A0AAN7TJE0_9PEZI|nr:hypothetical protein LTR62_002134 [Meristemomyces frigidus]
MPTLNHIKCSVELVANKVQLKEYGTKYSDRAVETFIAVPQSDLPFVVRLQSEGYIAPGLSAFVFIDGEYHSNRNKLNLKLPNEAIDPCESVVDFTFRQKEDKDSDGNFIGRPWTFAKLKTSNPDQAAASNQSFLKNVGTIEVVVLRCIGDGAKVETTTAPVTQSRRTSNPKAAPSAASSQNFGGMMGLFDGTGDEPSIVSPVQAITSYDGGYDEPQPIIDYDNPSDLVAQQIASMPGPKEKNPPGMAWHPVKLEWRPLMEVLQALQEQAAAAGVAPDDRSVVYQRLDAGTLRAHNRNDSYSVREDRPYHMGDDISYDPPATLHDDDLPNENGINEFLGEYSGKDQIDGTTVSNYYNNPASPNKADYTSGHFGAEGNTTGQTGPGQDMAPDAAHQQQMYDDQYASKPQAGQQQQPMPQQPMPQQRQTASPQDQMPTVPIWPAPLPAKLYLPSAEGGVGYAPSEYPMMLKEVQEEVARNCLKVKQLLAQIQSLPSGHSQIEPMEKEVFARGAHIEAMSALAVSLKQIVAQLEAYYMAAEVAQQYQRTGQDPIVNQSQAPAPAHASNLQQGFRQVGTGVVNGGQVKNTNSQPQAYDRSRQDRQPTTNGSCDQGGPGGKPASVTGGWSDFERNYAEQAYPRPKNWSAGGNGGEASAHGNHKDSANNRNRQNNSDGWADDNGKSSANGWHDPNQNNAGGWANENDKPASVANTKSSAADGQWGRNNDAKDEWGANNNTYDQWATKSSSDKKQAADAWATSSSKQHNNADRRSSVKSASAQTGGYTSTNTPGPVSKEYWSKWQQAPKPAGHSDQGGTKKPETARTPYQYAENPLPTVAEEKISGSVSFAVQAGKGAAYTHARRRPVYLDSMAKPYAVFSFKYRSVKTLAKLVPKYDVVAETKATLKKAEMENLRSLPKNELVERLLRMQVSGKEQGATHDSTFERCSQRAEGWQQAESTKSKVDDWNPATNDKSVSKGWGVASNHSGSQKVSNHDRDNAQESGSKKGSSDGWNHVQQASSKKSSVKNDWDNTPANGGGWDGKSEVYDTIKPVENVQNDWHPVSPQPAQATGWVDSMPQQNKKSEDWEYINRLADQALNGQKQGSVAPSTTGWGSFFDVHPMNGNPNYLVTGNLNDQAQQDVNAGKAGNTVNTDVYPRTANTNVYPQAGNTNAYPQAGNMTAALSGGLGGDATARAGRKAARGAGANGTGQGIAGNAGQGGQVCGGGGSTVHLGGYVSGALGKYPAGFGQRGKEQDLMEKYKDGSKDLNDQAAW